MSGSLPIRRRYVDAAFGQINVAEAGAGVPLMCIHQTPRSWDEFREVIETLGDRLHVVAFDLPGMGASDPLPTRPTIEGYAGAALVVADALGFEQFHVFGHHTGGVVAIELAARAPSRVMSAALSSTPWVDADARRVRQSGPPPVDVATHDVDGGHLRELWSQRRPYYPPGHELLDRFIIDALRAHDSAEGHLAVGRYEMEQRVGLIECPVLVIEHRDDPFSTRHTGSLIEQLQPASVVSIDHGVIPLEHAADEVARAVGDFVLG